MLLDRLMQALGHRFIPKCANTNAQLIVNRRHGLIGHGDFLIIRIPK